MEISSAVTCSEHRFSCLSLPAFLVSVVMYTMKVCQCFRYKPVFTLFHTLCLGFFKLKREFKSEILVSLSDTSLLTLFLPLALITVLVLYH